MVSKEIVEDVGSDESTNQKDDSIVGGGTAEKKRPNLKSKPGAGNKQGKVPRKRQTKNKV